MRFVYCHFISFFVGLCISHSLDVSFSNDNTMSTVPISTALLFLQWFFVIILLPSIQMTFVHIHRVAFCPMQHISDVNSPKSHPLSLLEHNVCNIMCVDMYVWKVYIVYSAQCTYIENYSSTKNKTKKLMKISLRQLLFRVIVIVLLRCKFTWISLNVCRTHWEKHTHHFFFHPKKNKFDCVLDLFLCVSLSMHILNCALLLFFSGSLIRFFWCIIWMKAMFPLLRWNSCQARLKYK